LGESRPRLALDAVGGEASGHLIKLLGPEGTFVCYAAPSYAPMALVTRENHGQSARVAASSFGLMTMAS
jgi:hypothetical protein